MAFQLRALEVTGPKVKSAYIDFTTGLNVISGPSDTGKSYLLEVIDFMLGAATPPRQIPESRGYNSATLLIADDDGREFQLIRSLQGGEFRLNGTDADSASQTMSARHSSSTEDNISSFLLKLVGLSGKRVRKNSLNEVQSLSFRHLSHLSLVDEESIIKKGSPVYSGEATQRTTQEGVFRLLLTGLDDSALVPSKRPAIAKAELEAQIALLDQLVGDYGKELAALTEHPSDLEDQMRRLTRSIAESELALSLERAKFREQEVQRKEAWEDRDTILVRQAEIAGLFERFALLQEHYRSDLDRLVAVSEAGSFFVALEAGSCPLCGAPAGDHQHDGIPHDGDIRVLQSACEHEIAKISQLQIELSFTMTALQAEQAELENALATAREAFNTADALVRTTLMPSLSAAREENTKLIDRRNEVRQALSLVERIAELSNRREDCLQALALTTKAEKIRAGLPAEASRSLTAEIEALLVSWSFPHEKPVFFDEKTQDLVLGNRRRGEQGKGLRALTHAAFSIGLSLAGRTLGLPIVGFTVLDSPLVTFREADAAEAGLDSAQKSQVKQAFYRDLASRVGRDQVVIIENEDPDAALRPSIHCHIFTKRRDDGRAGFFPT